MENRYYDEHNSEAVYDEALFDKEEDSLRPAKPVKHRHGKAARVVASALAFGLIAGTTFYGTTTILSNKIGTGRQMGTVAKASPESYEHQLLSNTDSSALPSTSTTGNTSVADVAATALPSLVTISCTSVEEMQNLYDLFGRYGFPFNSMEPQEREVSSCGTGVIIGQNADELLIATNDHVISGATTLSVGFIDETAISASVKGTDPDNDLAVVSVSISDIPQTTLDQISVASIGDSDALSLGEQVVAIGNALGYGQSVTSGIISAFNRDLTLASEAGGSMTSTGLIQTDASINAGNSGGGLFNMKGELIAINEAKSSSSSGQASVDNMGFAIPMAKALPILENLMKGEKPVQADNSTASAYLGISGADVSEEASKMYGLPIGVSIVEIAADSPAAECGLKTGDVITDFNGQAVSCFDELKTALSQVHPGDTVNITVYRSYDGEYQAQQLAITLGEKPSVS